MQYTLREVVQNRLLWIVLFFALIGIGGAAFVGDLAIIENRAVETSLLAAAYRFCAVFVMVIVVISLSCGNLTTSVWCYIYPCPYRAPLFLSENLPDFISPVS